MLQFPVSFGATWLTRQHSSGSGQCGVCRLRAGSTQKRLWELRLSAWRNINVVLDMSHQTPFPNELQKWSTIWPHLQHLGDTSLLQPRVEVPGGGTALRNGLRPPASGDCSVLGLLRWREPEHQRLLGARCWLGGRRGLLTDELQ